MEQKFRIFFWLNVNMLKHVATIPVIAKAITDTPDAVLPMIKIDPKTFCMSTLNSVAQKWLDSTSSTVISFESKKNDDDDDDLEDDIRKIGKRAARPPAPSWCGLRRCLELLG